MRLRSISLLFSLLPALSLSADVDVELTPESLYVGETAMLTVRMSGSDITAISERSLDLSGLEILRGPMTSSEYRWVNGRTTRTRVVQFLLEATSVAEGSVQISLLPPRGTPRVISRSVRISASSSSDLSLPGRAPWIVVELSSDEVFEGEQLIATWFVISETTGRTVMQELPDLSGFFVEELSVDDANLEPFSVRGENYLRWPVKRYALVPLSSGTRTLGALEALVPTRRISSWLEGLRSSLDTTARVRSSPVTLQVKQRPAEARLIGEFEMKCSSEPEIDSEGPVRIDVVVSGNGNLRSATAPQFRSDPGLIARTVSKPSEYRREEAGIEMRKEWTWLLMPEEMGRLSLPPLEFRYFDPASESSRLLRCGGWDVEIRSLPEIDQEEELAEAAPEPAIDVTDDPSGDGIGGAHSIGGVVLMAGFFGLLAFWFRTSRRRKREVENLMGAASQEPLFRQRLESVAIRRGWTPADLMDERGPAGDAWRAVHSSLDLMRREPWAEEKHRAILRERLRQLLASL